MKCNRNWLLNLILISGFAHAAEELPSALLQNLEPKVPANTLVLPAITPSTPAILNDFSQKLAEGIRSQLAKKMNRDSSEFQVSLENVTTIPSMTKVTGPIQILGMGSTGSNRLEGYMNLVTLVPTALGTIEFKVTGILKVTGPVVIAKNILPRDHKIAAEDLQIVRLPWRTLASGIPGAGESEFLGQRVRSLISAGSPIHPQNLEDPLDVQSGDLVELLIQSGPGVMIRSRGVAKQEGRVGDTIKIEQPDTKKKLSAVVRGPKSVEVQL